MHHEDDLLPISALQHLLFCERQTALIHLDRLWVENRLTAEGRVLHKKTDGAKSETRDGVRITRSLPVHSFKLGLFGVCDVVNFEPPAFEPQPAMSLPKRIERELDRLARVSGKAHDSRLTRAIDEAAPSKDGPSPQPSVPSFDPSQRRGSPGTEQASGAPDASFPLGRVKRDQAEQAFHHWTITPVEYKRGLPKKNDADRVQLCAQAMCLEEMLSVSIPHGELFYGKQQRRTEVALTEELRELTVRTADRLHALIAAGVTPRATREPKCENCSLLPVCMPPKSQSADASLYLHNLIKE